MSRNSPFKLCVELSMAFLIGIVVLLFSLINSFSFFTMISYFIRLIDPHRLSLTQPKTYWECFLCVGLILYSLLANSAGWLLFGYHYGKLNTRIFFHLTLKKSWQYIIKTIFYCGGIWTSGFLITLIKSQTSWINFYLMLGIAALLKLLTSPTWTTDFEYESTLWLITIPLFLLVPLVMFWLGFTGQYFNFFTLVKKIFKRSLSLDIQESTEG